MTNQSMPAISNAISRPSTAAPNTAVNSRSGSADEVRPYSMTRRPIPPRWPVEISATTTPTTAAAAAEAQTAGTMYGTAAGRRTSRSVWPHVAA